MGDFGVLSPWLELEVENNTHSMQEQEEIYLLPSEN